MVAGDAMLTIATAGRLVRLGPCGSGIGRPDAFLACSLAVGGWVPRVPPAVAPPCGPIANLRRCVPTSIFGLAG